MSEHVTSEHVTRLAETLVAEGITHAFGVAGGGTSIALIAALEERGVDYHAAAHEAAATMMAGAACRDGSTRAVAIGIKGPGFANMVPGMVSNAYENRPAMTVTEAYAPGAPSMHKRLDHSAIAASVVKAHGVSDGEGATARALLAIARDEVPGPVHLDLAPEPRGNEPPHAPERPPADEKAFEAVLDRIARAERPAFVLGSIAARTGADWTGAGVPTVTTASAKGAIDESCPWAAGVITGEMGPVSPERTVLREADLVVAFGLRASEVVRPAPFDSPVVCVDVVPDPARVAYAREAEVLVDDATRASEELIRALAARSWGTQLVADARRKVLSALDLGWLPPAAFGLMAERLPDGVVLVPDTGLFTVVAESVWRAASPDAWCGSGNGRFMGTAVPTAIGIAAGERRPVACVMGDGGVRPYLPEIRLAVDERLPIVFVLMSDGRYGTVSLASAAPYVPDAVRIASPSWWRAVEAMGCDAVLADTQDAFDAALAGWDPASGPLFVETPFDAEAYSAMTRDLR